MLEMRLVLGLTKCCVQRRLLRCREAAGGRLEQLASCVRGLSWAQSIGSGESSVRLV